MTAKAKPPELPARATSSKAKVEPLSDPDNLVDAAEIVEDSKPAPASSSKKHRRDEKSPSRRQRRSRSRRDGKNKRRSRSRSRHRGGEKGGSRSPKAEGVREKKTRSSRVRSTHTPPRPPPFRPPPGHSQPQGRGWVGRVPYSSRYRWSQGTNKGIVKRAKQERFNNRGRRRR